jgi:uncharacterized protein
MPVDTLVVKFAAPCNLACTYCYEYASGDQTWRSKPKFLTDNVAQQIGNLVKQHVETNALNNFKIVAHGGEPLLLGPDRLGKLFSTIRESAAPAKITFSLQTNATLLNPDFCRTLREHGVVVGISLDGGNEAQNNLRIDHSGKTAWSKIVKGISVLREHAPECFGGLLCVVNTEQNPVDVIDGLMSFDPPMIDLLQPFMSLDVAGDKREKIALSFGEWMVTAMQHWLQNHSHRQTKIRYFEDALKASVTGKPVTDWFGPRMVTYLVVESDGKIDLLDQLKAIGSESFSYRALEKTVWDCNLEEAANLARNLIHQHRGDSLPDDCHSCRWASVCGAGHLPSRFSIARGFNNRSTYCEGIQAILDECKNIMDPLWVSDAADRSQLGASVAATA